MSQMNLSSNKIYVVKPSVVIGDNTEYSFTKIQDRLLQAKVPISKDICTKANEFGIDIQPPGILSNINYHIQYALHEKAKKKNINVVTYSVDFETRPEDMTIALERYLTLKSVETDKIIYNGIGYHCAEGNLCVGVNPNDKILLARYLWERSVEATKYSCEIEKYILALKPYYTIEEIMVILEQLKSEAAINEEKPITFTLKRSSKQPIYTKGIY